MDFTGVLSFLPFISINRQRLVALFFVAILFVIVGLSQLIVFGEGFFGGTIGFTLLVIGVILIIYSVYCLEQKIF